MRAPYTVKATYVPRGGRIAEGLTQVLYTGSCGISAAAALEDMIAWANASEGGGFVDVEVFEGDKPIDYRGVSIVLERNHRFIGQGGPAYPAHTCGAPMLPLDLTSLPREPKALYCSGCGRSVEATAEQRMRAAGAAKADREAARAS